jgi:hypothetical protein
VVVRRKLYLCKKRRSIPLAGLDEDEGVYFELVKGRCFEQL